MPAAVAPEKARISDFELDRIDKLRGKNMEPKTIRATINRARAVRGLAPVSKTALYDYLKGGTCSHILATGRVEQHVGKATDESHQ